MTKCLYLIVDFSYGEDKIRTALSAGVDYVQLREKNITSAEYLARAKQMRTMTRQYHTKLIIDDRLDIALLSEADGVHVGQEDMASGEVRKILGDGKIIGVSAHNVKEALEAQANGADYLGVGAAFPTGSKDDVNVISHDEIKAICEAVNIPVIAIGGINIDNISSRIVLVR